MSGRIWADRLLGSAPSTTLFRRGTQRHLRILAYHGIHNQDAFAYHMAHLVRHYQPMRPESVVKALCGEIDLPDLAVWVTFDDGHPSVIETGLPIMLDHGISGTMFVCPGLVDTSLPYWWEVVVEALELGETGEFNGRRFDRTNVADFVAVLKSAPDPSRREIVQNLSEAIVVRTGTQLHGRQVTTAQLEAFIASGGQVGNHSWDHPCLDTCEDAEVADQIKKADQWLSRLGAGHRVFAYPNGNHSPSAAEALARLGYHAAVLFDHRLASVGDDRLMLSRLRVNHDTTLDRFAAIVAGVHPTIHRLRSRISARVR